ncbi:hypothetical protein GYMLUDRAFT_62541 [Collybiopsis luxurians FD-317 M1]|uniref:Uncharacterized protein n=1 Tax=Collybiopsis luxurians FD-317 M1 TaxID=944289 RepID=A0A0D0AXQ8_9AGAR|nr:hypothetical protein GYMLUDRAFT_62541 [Collybiopsis luxurians FD-317 M1]
MPQLMSRSERKPKYNDNDSIRSKFQPSPEHKLIFFRKNLENRYLNVESSQHKTEATLLPEICSDSICHTNTLAEIVTFPFGTHIGPLMGSAQVIQISKVSKSLETWLKMVHVHLPGINQDSSAEVTVVQWANHLPIIAESLSGIFLEGLYSNNLLFYQHSCALLNDIISALNMASAVRDLFSAASRDACLHPIAVKLADELLMFNEVCAMATGLKIAWEIQLRIWITAPKWHQS